MRISGLQKLTLLDFPGHTACTVFTGGCNYRCPFCHHAELVLRPELQPEVPEGEFFGHTAKLELGFGYFGEEEQPRLVSIRVHLFLEDGEPDYIVLVGDCIDPGNRDAGTWTSPVTLEDAVDREALEEFYPNWSGEYLEDRLAQPLWIVVVESLNGPSDVFGFETVTTGKREFTYAAAGQYQVLAQLLTGEK